MIGILTKYKMLIFILSLVMLAAMLWFLTNKHEIERIPSRGVFVTETLFDSQTENLNRII